MVVFLVVFSQPMISPSHLDDTAFVYLTLVVSFNRITVISDRWISWLFRLSGKGMKRKFDKLGVDPADFPGSIWRGTPERRHLCRVGRSFADDFRRFRRGNDFTANRIG